MDSPKATEVTSWIHCLALYLRYLTIHECRSLLLPPYWECELRQKAGRRRVGRCCVFYCRVSESERQVFLSAAAVEVRNIRSLCDVGQNQQQGFLRGQIRGSTAQHAAWGPLQQTQIHLRLLMIPFSIAMCVECSCFGRYALWKTGVSLLNWKECICQDKTPDTFLTQD